MDMDPCIIMNEIMNEIPRGLRCCVQFWSWWRSFLIYILIIVGSLACFHGAESVGRRIHSLQIESLMSGTGGRR